jgi:hypothetical protein
MPSTLLDRFDPRPLFFDHWRSMRRVRPDIEGNNVDQRPDIAARAFLYGAPVLVGALSLWQQWKLTDPASVGAGSALIAGILFAAFTQLATLRERLEDRSEPISSTTRQHFRETAAHLLMGALAAAVEAAILVGASGARNHPDDKLAILPTGVVLAVGTYVFLLFTMAVRRVYATYLKVFEGGLYLMPPDRRKKRRSATD